MQKKPCKSNRTPDSDGDQTFVQAMEWKTLYTYICDEKKRKKCYRKGPNQESILFTMNKLVLPTLTTFTTITKPVNRGGREGGTHFLAEWETRAQGSRETDDFGYECLEGEIFFEYHAS